MYRLIRYSNIKGFGYTGTLRVNGTWKDFRNNPRVEKFRWFVYFDNVKQAEQIMQRIIQTMNNKFGDYSRISSHYIWVDVFGGEYKAAIEDQVVSLSYYP